MKPPKTETLQKEIARAALIGVTASINSRPGGGYRTIYPGYDNYSPSKPIIVDGKKMSLAQARQFIDARINKK